VSADAGNASKLGTDGKIWTSAAPTLPTDLVRGKQNTTATALTLWTGTKAQYDAIATKDPKTVYVVTGGTATLQAALQEATGVETLEGLELTPTTEA
jgi:hypothetical protein